jgi:hypothetical protein
MKAASRLSASASPMKAAQVVLGGCGEEGTEERKSHVSRPICPNFSRVKYIHPCRSPPVTQVTSATPPFRRKDRCSHLIKGDRSVAGLF